MTTSFSRVASLGRRAATLFILLCSINALADTALLHDGPVLLTSVTIIDGKGTEPYLYRDILVNDGVVAGIYSMGMAPDLPDNTKIIKGKGLTVMPGLIDAHAHLGSGVDYSRTALTGQELANMQDGSARVAHGFGYSTEGPDAAERYFSSMLYSGVTSLLEVGGNLEKGLAWREAFNSGQELGPTLYISGQTIEALQVNENGVWDRVSPEGKAEVAQLIEDRSEAQVDHVKIYAGVAVWEAIHIVDEAHKAGFKVMADFWGANLSRDIMELTDLDSYAHGGTLRVSPEDARWMARNDKFATLTLSIYESMTGERVYSDFEKRELYDEPLIAKIWGKKAVDDYYANVMSYMEQWHNDTRALYKDQLWGVSQGFLKLNLDNARVMWEEGVLFGMGTDTPVTPGNWPGESMHRELELHVMAGIPPLEAIKLATYNNARYIGVEDRVGSVERGKVADLLVVEGNPADNISDTRNVRYVFTKGRLVDRSALER